MRGHFPPKRKTLMRRIERDYSELEDPASRQRVRDALDRIDDRDAERLAAPRPAPSRAGPVDAGDWCPHWPRHATNPCPEES